MKVIFLYICPELNSLSTQGVTLQPSVNYGIFYVIISDPILFFRLFSLSQKLSQITCINFQRKIFLKITTHGHLKILTGLEMW